MWNSGGTSWVESGGWITQHIIICGLHPHIGSQLHLGPDNNYVGGKYVQEIGSTYKPW